MKGAEEVDRTLFATLPRSESVWGSGVISHIPASNLFPLFSDVSKPEILVQNKRIVAKGGGVATNSAGAETAATRTGGDSFN